MQTVEALILTLSKKTADAAWVVSIESASGIVFSSSIGQNGKTRLGSLFSQTLVTLNQKHTTYPVQYDLRPEGDPAKRRVSVGIIANQPGMIELLPNTKTYLETAASSNIFSAVDESVSVPENLKSFSQITQENARITSNGTDTIVASNEDAPESHRYWVLFDTNENDLNVVDGDTFYGRIKQVVWPEGESVPQFVGKQDLWTPSSYVGVRYLGLDCFETNHGENKDAYRNKNKADLYGVSYSVLDDAAEEAKFLNQAILRSHPIVAVSLQYNKNTNKPYPESSGGKRLLGVVYVSPYNTAEETARAIVSGDFRGINANKEILKPMFSRYKEIQEEYDPSVPIPLAEYTGAIFGKPTDGLNITSWFDELGLQLPPDKDTLKNASYGTNDGSDNVTVAVEDYQTTYKYQGGIRDDIGLKGHIDNSLSFVVPYDDRVANAISYSFEHTEESTGLPWDYTHRVRIGDVFLTIPPLSIRLDKQYQNQKVSTMRAKSSLQKGVGNVRNVLTMDLYYHDLESINGKEAFGYRTKEKEEIIYAMDGLRSLLAQFKKAPFLPIDNYYVNETLGIHNVALRNIHAETIQGFPDALKVTLIVEEFDSAPYLMGETKLGSKINYPLLRWHYQQLLHEPYLPTPWRSYLPKIEKLDNRITFSILNEDALAMRQQNIREFRTKKTPGEFKINLLSTKDKEGEELAQSQKYNDALRIADVFEQLTRFDALTENKKLFEKYGLKRSDYEKWEIPICTGDQWGIDGFADNLTKNEMLFGKEAAILLYGEDITNIGYSNPVHLFSDRNYLSWKDINKINYFTPLGLLDKGDNIRDNLYNASSKAFNNVKNNEEAGFVHVWISNPDNLEKLKDYATKTTSSDDSTLVLIPAGKLSQDKLKELQVSGEKHILQVLHEIGYGKSYQDKATQKIENYNLRYNALAAEINRTEATLPMDNIFISGLLPTSLQISLENTFSNIQVQTAETPTMQYFGAQDPQIQISFDIKKEGVKQLQEMLMKVGRYTKEYRESLVTGFMQLDNPLLNLFGIRAVLPESIQYNTVSGQPDMVSVTMVLSAFDKTQRRQEALYGYTGGNPDESLKDRAFENYDPAKDSMYVHEHMKQMELYPDLEMAKVSELNDVIYRFDSKMMKFDNRTEQVFLDPDFYISTTETFRNYLKDTIEDSKGVTTNWSDAAGYKASSDLKQKKPLLMPDEMATRFETEAAQTDYIDPETTWSDFEDESTAKGSSKDAELLSTSRQSVEVPEYKNEAIATFIQKEGYKTRPTMEQWVSWGNKEDKDAFSKWLQNSTSNPKPEAIWLKIADAVLTHFNTDEMVFAEGEKEIILDKKSYPKKRIIESYTQKAGLGVYTWAPIPVFYSMHTNGLETELDPMESLENGKSIVKAIKEDAAYSDVTRFYAVGSPYFKTSSEQKAKIPFQRVLSFIRSILAKESGTRTVDENGSAILSEKNTAGLFTRGGIAGARLTGIEDKNELVRLLWDWEYNIETVVKKMATVYNRCEESPYLEIKARSLDWAVVAHSGASMPAILKSQDEKDDKEKGFMDGAIDPDRSEYLNEVDNYRKKEASMATNTNATGIYYGPEGIIEPIFELYNIAKLPTAANPVLLPDEVEEKVAQYGVANALEEERKSLRFNMENWTPEQKYKGMFVDMYQHDQTGRMLRAFPSFSLQIVDEGKWYNNFRTWDNFYGFNALHSIDVYKSRKIAADTAVIQMSNMYGGLTTKRKDMEYTDLILPSFFSAQFWEQDVLNIPEEDLLEDRKEMFKTMMLQTGARVHLRMGYGSDARYLPVVFNGTITEIGTGDVLEVVCQGDGLELTNVISGSEKDSNKEMGFIVEPSEYIGKLLTSKGNWIKDFISNKSNGEFFRESPLGIAHFGSFASAPEGTWNLFNSDFGESMQNVYSQNGQFSKEQWRKPDGSKISAIDMLFGGVTDGSVLDLSSLTSEDDEDNIRVKLYGNTPWDIIQTFALCSSDYVASVFPFETRSSLFFGKPHWPVTYKYDNQFVYDEATGKWSRSILDQHKKTFMQMHIYHSALNIISNNIIASEEGVYPNVIVSYDGHTVGPMQADNDIRLDRQKTALVEANIMGKFGTSNGWMKIFGSNFYTAEAQAQVYGMSTVRDYMKDMYKGNYLVLGDPTVKPYDACYLSDTVQDMQGIHLVKAVHHSMSLETGFISTIEPDAYVVNWDAELLFLPDKMFDAGKNVCLRAGGTIMSAYLANHFSGSVMHKLFDDIVPLLENVTIPVGRKMAETLSRFQTKYYYQLLGFMTDHTEIKELAEQLSKLPGEEDASVFTKRIYKILETERENIKQNKKYLKTLKKQAKAVERSSKLGVKQEEILAEIVGKYGDDIAESRRLVEEALAVGKTARVTGVAGKGLSIGGGVLKKAWSIGSTVVKSSLFWTVVIDLTIEVATSGLLEMWTRRKQNAECVKIVPLKYKGQNYTAGINGHRGGVWGDSASLADKIRNAEFGDPDIETNFWTIIPQFLNYMDYEDEAMDTTLTQGETESPIDGE